MTEKETTPDHDSFEPWMLAAVMVLLVTVVLTGCGSQVVANTDSESAAASAEVSTTMPTTTEASTTTTTTTEASTTTTAMPSEDVAPASETGEVVAEEPRFELIGELDLTTAEVNDMVAFVEASAGRDFLRPPVIEVQSIEDFEAELVPSPEIAALMEESAEANARLYQALGYTAQGVGELANSLADLGQSTDFISGRYDPTADVVYMPEGVLVGDEFNAILVHELLHALDGQHVDLVGLLDRLEELAGADTGTDEAFSIIAVVEGRATAVQFEWMFANNVIPSQTDIPEAFNTVPAAAINAAILPYQLGAQSIIELGGPAETWDLYDDFPTSSEQMVFPSRIGNDEPIAVEAPLVEGEIFFEGVNGVEGLLILGLGDTLEPEPALIFEILAAAEGWGGDHFVLSGDKNQSCLTGSIAADTPEDLAELESLFSGWSARETASPVTRTAVVDAGLLTISSCAPFNA